VQDGFWLKPAHKTTLVGTGKYLRENCMFIVVNRCAVARGRHDPSPRTVSFESYCVKLVDFIFMGRPMKMSQGAAQIRKNRSVRSPELEAMRAEVFVATAVCCAILVQPATAFLPSPAAVASRAAVLPSCSQIARQTLHKRVALEMTSGNREVPEVVQFEGRRRMLRR